MTDESLASQRNAPAIPKTLRWGIALALATALISGISIWINAFAVKQLPDPAVYTTLKNGVAALLLLGLAAITVRPVQVREIPRRSWAWIAVIGVIGGSLPFVLFFTGLAQASAPSAAFIHKTLFVWVALLAVPFLGERLGLVQLGALGVLLAGQALVLTPSGVTWGSGETLIAAATLLWAVETIVAKRVLRAVPSQVLAVGRLGGGLVVLLGYLAATGKLGVVAGLTPVQLGWALLTGLFLFGYVGTWFAALQRAPASLVTAILVLGAPVTALAQVAQTGALPAIPALSGQLLILVAGATLALPALLRLRGGSAAATEPLRA
jgi:drug/metabolite transporter (DMT)-like permease